MKSLPLNGSSAAGAGRIGMRVAEAANIPYYDGELLYKAAGGAGNIGGKTERV